MTYLFDTNVIIDFTKTRGSSIGLKLRQVGVVEIAISSITIAELEYGEAKSQQPSRSLAEFRRSLSQMPILDFDEKAAKAYGQVRADLERRGLLIGGNDMMIASVALANNLVLVTRDVSEFSRVQGLRIEDWSK